MAVELPKLLNSTPMEEIDSLLDSLVREKTKEYNYAENFTDKIEGEYKSSRGENDEQEETSRSSRQIEKRDLDQKIKELKNKLARIKNIKNGRGDANSDQATKRKNLREKIRILKEKIEIIDMEEEGAETEGPVGMINSK